MSLRRYLLTSACIASMSVAFGIQRAEAISLNEALALAYEKNPEVNAERQNLRASFESMPQAISGFLPNVEADFTRGRENESIGTGRDNNRDTASRGLTVSQPLYRGGETISRIGRADANVALAKSRLRDLEQQVMSQAVAAYVDVVRTRRVLELSKNNEKVLAEQLQATKVRFDLGETTRTDVAQSESRFSRAQSDRISAEGDAIAARAKYRNIFGQEADDKMELPKTLPSFPKNVKEVLERAKANSPSLQGTKFNTKIADKDVDIAIANLLPNVDLIGQIERDTGLGSFRGGSIDSNSVTVQVSVPLFQSGSEYSRIRQAKRTKGRADFQLEDAERSLEETVTAAWKDVETTRAIIKSTKAAVDAAKVALDGVKQEHEVGSRTVLDILDAEQELFSANVNLVGANRNEVVAVYNLLAAMGDLSPEYLGLNVERFDVDKYYDKVKYKMVGF